MTACSEWPVGSCYYQEGLLAGAASLALSSECLAARPATA